MHLQKAEQFTGWFKVLKFIINNKMIFAVCPNPSIDTFVHFYHFKSGEVNRVAKEMPYPGGKGTHVAMGIKELGEEVTLLGFWAGPTGMWIKQQLEAKGITCIGPQVQGMTRTCLTFKTNDSYDDTEILGTGPEITNDEFHAFVKQFEQEIKRASLIVMSGSWPKGAPDFAYARLVEIAKGNNIPVMLDATGSQFVQAFEKAPSAFHLNKKEAEAFTGVHNIRGMLIKISEKINIAAITDGKKGLYYLHGKIAMHGNLSLENIYSAVGSGDALTAGIVVSMHRRYNDEETVKLAVSCGAANCLRKELGMFYKKDVDSLLNKVSVDKIEIEIP